MMKTSHKLTLSTITLLTCAFGALSGASAEDDIVGAALEQLIERENAMALVHYNAVKDPLQKQRIDALKGALLNKAPNLQGLKSADTRASLTTGSARVRAFDLDARACTMRLSFRYPEKVLTVSVNLRSTSPKAATGGWPTSSNGAKFTVPANNTSVDRLGYLELVPRTANLSSVETKKASLKELTIKEGTSLDKKIQDVVKYVCPQGEQA